MRALLPLLVLALAGCSGMHRHGAARTLAPGESAHHFSADRIALDAAVGGTAVVGWAGTAVLAGASLVLGDAPSFGG